MRKTHLGLVALLSVGGCSSGDGGPRPQVESTSEALSTTLGAGTLGDFDGDGHGDILFRVPATGAVSLWRMNGATVLGSSTIWSSIPNEWQIVGTGRFNRDANSDILWRNLATGELAVWFMYGAGAPSMQTFSLLGTSWRVKGVGDFDGSGYDDILLQNASGEVATWLMDGSTVVSKNTLTASTSSLAAGSEIVGVGDFDGDRHEDILWRSPTGSDVVVWSLRYGKYSSTRVIQTGIGPSWHVSGLADFDRDRQADILWRNFDTGDVAMSRQQPATLTTTAWVFSPVWSAVPMDWQIGGATNFDSDGRADIFWRDSSSASASLWLMNGSAVLSMPMIYGGIPAGWQPAAADPGQKLPTVDTTFVALQPGWVRATMRWSEFVNSPQPSLTVTCASPTPPASIVIGKPTIDATGRVAVFDIRTNDGWLYDHGRPTPCHVAGATSTLDFGPASVSRTRTIDFAMDKPLRYRTFDELASLTMGASADLVVAPASRRHVAFPPRTFAVKTMSGSISVIEVEELPGRKTLGLRALTTLNATGGYDLDLNGGAELFDGWGIDVERRGVTRDTYAQEESNPSMGKFPTDVWTAATLTSGAKVFPAPPLFSEADQIANTLDNHEIPRVLRAVDPLDVKYDLASHRLVAVNGASIVALDLGGPIDAASTAAVGAPTIVAATPRPIRTTVDPTEKPRHTQKASPSCVLGATPARPLTTCKGFEGGGNYVCPTPSDPIRPETFPDAPGAGGELLIRVSPPLVTNQSTNTCGTSGLLDSMQPLLNRYVDDLAPKRTVSVDGAPIVVPEPRIGLSPAGALWNLYRWAGTKIDHETDPTLVPSSARDWPGDDGASLPQFAEGYWPARLRDNAEWHAAAKLLVSARAQSAILGCEDPDGKINNFWSGFCMGQGGPPPGVYRNYSNMAAGAAANPLRDGAWSVVNTHNPVILGAMDGSNLDRLIQTMILELQNGLPLRISWSIWDHANLLDSDGTRSYDQYTVGTGWSLPPEVAGCDPAALAADTGSRNDGHFGAIVGYSIAGDSLTNPDLTNSYFIIRNNWGSESPDDRDEYWTMSFAYFKQASIAVNTLRLNRKCASSVCATH